MRKVTAQIGHITHEIKIMVKLGTPSIHPDNYVKETLGCWIGDPGVSWTQWLILGSSTGVITPNISVVFNPGNLHIAINHYGRATYDNQIDYTRNHGAITPRYGLGNIPVYLQSIANISSEGANSGSYIQSYYTHGTITPNIRSVVNYSDMFFGMIIEDGLGQDIWNTILTFNG